MSFALAQAAYAAVQLLGLFGAIAWQLRSRNRGWLPAAAVGDGWQLLPSRRSADAAGAGSGWVTPQWCSREVAAEGRAMSKQAVLKHLLTEGDKFILLVAGGDKQGENDAVYGLVFNLGARHTTPTFFMSSFPSPPASTPPQRPSFPFPLTGSVAGRLLFEPVETQSRVQFSKLAAGRRAVAEAEHAAAAAAATGTDGRARLDAAAAAAVERYGASWLDNLLALRTRCGTFARQPARDRTEQHESHRWPCIAGPASVSAGCGWSG